MCLFVRVYWLCPEGHTICQANSSHMRCALHTSCGEAHEEILQHTVDPEAGYFCAGCDVPNLSELVDSFQLAICALARSTLSLHDLQDCVAIWPGDDLSLLRRAFLQRPHYHPDLFNHLVEHYRSECPHPTPVGHGFTITPMKDIPFQCVFRAAMGEPDPGFMSLRRVFTSALREEWQLELDSMSRELQRHSDPAGAANDGISKLLRGMSFTINRAGSAQALVDTYRLLRPIWTSMDPRTLTQLMNVKPHSSFFWLHYMMRHSITDCAHELNARSCSLFSRPFWQDLSDQVWKAEMMDHYESIMYTAAAYSRSDEPLELLVRLARRLTETRDFFLFEAIQDGILLSMGVEGRGDPSRAVMKLKELPDSHPATALLDMIEANSLLDDEPEPYLCEASTVSRLFTQPDQALAKELHEHALNYNAWLSALYATEAAEYASAAQDSRDRHDRRIDYDQRMEFDSRIEYDAPLDYDSPMDYESPGGEDSPIDYGHRTESDQCVECNRYAEYGGGNERVQCPQCLW